MRWKKQYPGITDTYHRKLLMKSVLIRQTIIHTSTVPTIPLHVNNGLGMYGCTFAHMLKGLQDFHYYRYHYNSSQSDNLMGRKTWISQSHYVANNELVIVNQEVSIYPKIKEVKKHIKHIRPIIIYLYVWMISSQDAQDFKPRCPTLLLVEWFSTRFFTH